MTNERVNCVLCGSRIPEPVVLHGHSPAPILDEGKCCRECNSSYVLAVRVMPEEYKAQIQSTIREAKSASSGQSDEKVIETVVAAMHDMMYYGF